jgi:hypothetical protein
MRRAIAALLLSSCGESLWAAELKPQTSSAFDRYIAQTEQRLDGRPEFLWADQSPSRERRILGGAVVVESVNAKATTAVPSGLVHDWIGCVFLPGVSLERTLALMRDYDHQKDFFGPEVVDSRILGQHDDAYRVYMRLRKSLVLTVVLDTEHQVQYVRVDANRWRSSSRSTKISEVEKPGTSQEHDLPPGTGQGFLWRLNSYWRFMQRDGGTWVECEAISLTRDIPAGLGWVVMPIIQDLPKQSLENTLREARAALVK